MTADILGIIWPQTHLGVQCKSWSGCADVISYLFQQPDVLGIGTVYILNIHSAQKPSCTFSRERFSQWKCRVMFFGMGLNFKYSDTGCQSRGFEFEQQFCLYSFRRFTKVTVTSLIRLSTNGLTVYVVKQPVVWKVCGVVSWSEKARKHMSMWTGRREMTEILLKTALKTYYILNTIKLFWC